MKTMVSVLFVIVTLVITGYVANTDNNISQSPVHTEICKATTEKEIASLYDKWNQSLQTGDPHKVVANYAERSILLPTVSNKPRLTPAEKEDYFHHFLENGPSGEINLRMIDIGCNSAVDAGLYTFTFKKTGTKVSARYTYTYRWDGKQWLITSHHSSAMPEKQLMTGITTSMQPIGHKAAAGVCNISTDPYKQCWAGTECGNRDNSTEVSSVNQD